MLKKMRGIYLLKNKIYGEPKAISKQEYMALSDEEKEFADVQIEDDKYIVRTPKEVTAEEMNEIINIQTAADISEIKKYLGEIKFIITFCFVATLIVALITVFSMLF